MFKSISIFLVSVLSLSTFASPQLYDLGGKYQYIMTPACEMSDRDQATAVNEAKNYLVRNLQELIGDNDVAEKPVEFLAKYSDEIEDINAGVLPYLKYDVPFFQLQDLCPSAFMVFFGGGYNKTFFQFVNFGGSAVIGLIVQPLIVDRINKIDPSEEKRFLTWKSSVVLMGVVNPGVSLGEDGGNTRWGGGLIFGEMSDPSQFVGVPGGVSLTVPTSKAGIQFKWQRVANKTGDKFDLVAVARVKEKKKISAHINVGWIQPLTQFMGAVDKVTGKFVTRGSSEYKELRALGQM